MTDRMLVPAETPDGEIVVVPVIDLDGSAIVDEGDPPALAGALRAVDGLSTKLHAALRATAAPDTAKIEFSIGFAMRNGKITTMLADANAEGSVAITMEWTTNQGQADARPRRWWSLRRRAG